MSEARDDANEFASLFPAIYLRFHRRDEKRSELSGASRAVLMHLSLTGPLTVTEAAQHLDRAQSVVSEIFEHLEAKGLLERIKDTRDRRRALVWLTPEGLDFLERDRDVLSRDLLLAAMNEMPSKKRKALLEGAKALVEAHETLKIQHPNHDKKTKRRTHHE